MLFSNNPLQLLHTPGVRLIQVDASPQRFTRIQGVEFPAHRIFAGGFGQQGVAQVCDEDTVTILSGLGTFAGLLRDSRCCGGDLRGQSIKEPAVGNVRFGLLDHDLHLAAWGNFALRTCRLKGLNKTVDSARNVR